MQRPALRSSLMIPGSPCAGPVIVIYYVAGRIASDSPGKKAAAAENRYLLLVAGLRLIRFSGGLSPVYGSDVFPVLHAFEAYAGDVVVCLCTGFFVGVAESCHAKHSAA